jgi:hypothetical protein
MTSTTTAYARQALTDALAQHKAARAAAARRQQDVDDDPEVTAARTLVNATWRSFIRVIDSETRLVRKGALQ